MIKLSIALVTRNRPDNLNRVLQSVLSQNTDIHEIIVSDDSNDEDSKQQNRLIAERFDCKYIAGPQKGLYANRNCALKNCSGTHIRTMDDDHTFPESHFLECLNAINEEPTVIWTIGEYNHMVKNENRVLPSPIAGELKARGFSSDPTTLDDYYGISCGGTIYPRKIIDDKIFNCDYYKFGKMYLEYGSRLKFKGFRLKPLLSTYIIHNDDRLLDKNSLITFDMIEATHFAIFCFSFKYKPSLKNKSLTLLAIIIDLLTGKIEMKNTLNAYANYKKFILTEL